MKTWMKTAALATLLIAALTLLGGALYQNATETAVLRARADRLFAYDHSHHNVLPAHRLRALSIALQFRDDLGAAALLNQLERSI